MQVTLFKALKSINVDDEQATAVVAQLEEHLEKMIVDATKNLEAQNKSLEAKLDSTRIGLEAKLDAQRTQISFVGGLLGVIGLAIAAGPIVAKFLP